MKIIRKDSLTPTPWKNGRGITHEVVRVPATGASFRWRLSVAQIESSGPFSDFAGYDRQMALLRGAGVSLTFENGQRTYLREPGDLVQFDGGLRTECELLDGPCVDLNLMVSQSHGEVAAWVARLDQPLAVDASANRLTLIVGISGTIGIAGRDAQTASLEPWDVAIIPAGWAATVNPVLAADSGVPLVFFATLDDNPV